MFVCRFHIPLVYEQTLRPVPVAYSLGTEFDLSRPLPLQGVDDDKVTNSNDIPQEDANVYLPGTCEHDYV